MIRACLSPRVWLAELNHATWQVGLQHYCRIHDVCTWWPHHRHCARRDHAAGSRIARALATDPALIAALTQRAARVRADADAELARLGLPRRPTGGRSQPRKDRRG